MKKFVKVSDLKLVNGGYLVSGKEEIPVVNAEFLDAQKRAEYIIAFAKIAKTKDFVGKKADSLDEVRALVSAELSDDKVKYIESPKKPSQTINNELKNEALAFMSFGKDSEKVDKINDFLNEFNIINDFEEFGLYFDEGIVKLNKIYTIKEIKEAVESVIELV